jgi:hypothetical protein
MTQKISLENDVVSLPASFVKSPGFLLKDKKDPSDHKFNRKNIQRLLIEFKHKTDSSLGSEINSPVLTVGRSSVERSSLVSQSASSSSDVSTFFPSPITLTPEKAISLENEMPTIVQKAIDILLIYDIGLIVNLPEKNFEDVYQLLKYLLPEICTFETNFFKKLNIKHFVVHKEGDVMSLISQVDTSFCVDELNTREKVLQRLFKIMFEHLVILRPSITKEWKDVEPGDIIDLLQSLLSAPSKMEEVFIMLMKNTNNAHIKPKTTKLREILRKNYPEIMSDEFFTMRAKEKKKMLKVHFTLE